MRAAGCLLLGLAGCDLVFGLGDRPPGPPVVDAATYQVNGTFEARWTELDAAGSPVAHVAAYPTDRIHLEVDLAGTTMPVAVDAQGSFRFAIGAPDALYALSIDTPYAHRRYQLTAANPHLIEELAGYPDRTIVPSTTGIHLTSTGTVPAASNYQAAVALGLWAKQPFPEATTLPYDWAWGSGAFSNPQGLLRADRHDAIGYLSYEKPVASPPYSRVSHAAIVHDVAMTPGANSVVLPVAPVATNQCAQLVAHRQSLADRLAPLVGPELPTPASLLSVDAVPSTELGLDVGYELAFQQAEFGEAPQSFMYGDPLAPLPLMATMVVLRGRLGEPYHFTAVSVQQALPADCATVADLTADLTSIPSGLVFDGHTLTADNQDVQIDRSQPIVVTWDQTLAGHADYFVASVVEIVTPTTEDVALAVFTSAQSVTLPSALFGNGKTYVLKIEAISGTPDAAAGDFRSRVLPQGKAILQSARFIAR